MVVVDRSVGGEGGRTEDLHCTPGRGGKREREEVVERLRRQEREQLPGRWQGLLRFYGRRSVRGYP